MAGYSGTPLPWKLGIKAGHRVALINAPAGFAFRTDDLDQRVSVQRSLGRASVKIDVIVTFVTRLSELRQGLSTWRAHMAQNGGLWVAWPKKASGVVTDVTEQSIRDVALPTGLVDNKVCAIDDTWSGLRLVIRLSERG